ncbi:MAG: GNAT family N-acetyltransferase [Oscillochloridaceae bacterium]|nr:GNAT family N-acetyltransferase [Chloroflexaceae bacterium]MDW8389370.1 GNAT family N-acetyltransferase [Oscillochloridaceae bacterium]
MATETVTLRPATSADAEALAELVVQLFHAEMPGVLRGPRPGQVRLMRYLVEHELASGVRGRFIALDAGGKVVGSASIRLHGDASTVNLPRGTFTLAIHCLGLLNTLILIGNMLRAALVGETRLRPGECYIYSVVVAEDQRGRGIGDAIMERIEDQARRMGVSVAYLRVISSNEPARRLYLRRGYQIVSRASPLAGRISIPSELMRKDLR